MKTVNPYFLHTFLEPLIGLADDDEVVRYYEEDPPNSEEKYKKIIREILVSNYINQNETRKEKAKLALSYYLSKKDSDFERVFFSSLIPFDPPNNVREFFVWLWEELFNNENFIIHDLETYKVVPDIHEPNRY